MQTFMDAYGPQCVYAPNGLIFLFFFMFFFIIITPKTLQHPHITDTHMKDFYHHHSIMYDTNPLYSPVLLHIVLLFVRTFPLSLLV